MKGFMAILKILLISVCCYAAGSAGLVAVQRGLRDVWMAPLFVVYLWWYLLPIALLVWLMWVLHRHVPASPAWRGSFVAAGAVVGCCVIEALAVVVSPPPNADEVLAGLVGAAIAGAAANTLIPLLQGRGAEPGAPPNGRPAERFGSSGGSGGLPSVS
jgi:hypothetical protein